MLSKKEYKENLIRVWDSIRDDEHKGREDCGGVTCGDCPLYKKACGSLSAFEAVEFVEQWAKEHPIKTNAEKFEEVFGVDVSFDTCFMRPSLGFNCRECGYYNADNGGCKVDKLFWNAEYKEPAESEE